MKKLWFANTLTLLALSAVALLAPPSAPAQAPPAATPLVPGAPQARTEPRISLDIKLGLIILKTSKQGGETRPATLGNVVQILQAQAPEADFVLSPGVAEVVVSNLTLRSAFLSGALEALSFATGNKVRGASLGKGNLYALTLTQPARPEKVPEKGIEVFNLSPILDTLGPRDSDAVHRYIEGLCILVSKTIDDFDARNKQQHGPSLVNFHQETGLLVVIAHPDQLEVASRIVQALTSVPIRRPGVVLATPKAEERPKSKGPADSRGTTP
jgi:hypothetical protein